MGTIKVAGTSIIGDEVRLLRQCVGEIESVRRRRQAACRTELHSALKRFTQQELAEEACPTYKNLLMGRSNRLPSRTTILRIAEYLECTLAEQNDLLISAGYLPQAVWMREDLFRRALEQAKTIASHSLLPSLVCGPDLQVIYINTIGKKFTLRGDVEKLSDLERCIGGACFVPDSYSRYAHSPSHDDWKRNASMGVRVYRSMTRPFQFEPWYKDRLERLKRLPDFQTFWDESATIEQASESTGQCRSYLVNGLIALSGVTMNVGGIGGPIVHTVTPVNDAARAALRIAGAESNKLL